MTRVRITFASEHGPTTSELAALRSACTPLASTPVQALARALRGVRSLIVEIASASPPPMGITQAELEALMRAPVSPALDERAARGSASLAAAGLRPEPISAPYGPESIARELGCAPLAPGEHRWTFMPSFHPELVVTALPMDDVWHVEVRRPDVSLWAAVWNPWRATVPRYQLGPGSQPTEPDLEPPPPRPTIEVERAVASPRTSRYARDWLDQLHGAPWPGPREILDGMRVELRWREGDVVDRTSTQSPPREDVHGRALILAGLTLAGNVKSRTLLAALDALAP